jgi:hypothetical protein
MPVLFAICLAAPMFAGDKPAVGIAALKAIEKTTNERFAAESQDPWDLVGDTRGTYISGYGTYFTLEVALINIAPMFPFRPQFTPQDIKDAHDRKIRKLAILKTAICDLMVKAASELTTLPATEQISFETYFFSFSFEDHTGLPNRLTMSASRQKLLDAGARHATPKDVAAIVSVQEEE